MQQPTQADLFIETLKDMLEADREIRRTRFQAQIKQPDKIYVAAFPDDQDEGIDLLEWIPDRRILMRILEEGHQRQRWCSDFPSGRPDSQEYPNDNRNT